MATNLRLSPTTEAALRAEAARSGRSQQDLIREALDRHLGLAAPAGSATELDALVASGVIRPPRTPYRRVTRRITLPEGTSSADLLDREDRL